MADYSPILRDDEVANLDPEKLDKAKRIFKM